MVLRFDARDVSGFKLLFSLAIMYGLMSFVVHSVINTKFIKPLGINAPLDRFSEARAVEHVRVLSHDIGNRQEGRPGLREAAEYIKAQLERMKERAGSKIRIEIEENVVSGSFAMLFLGHGISFDYRNLTNILMREEIVQLAPAISFTVSNIKISDRISSIDSKHSDPSVLVNAHFDTTLGSPGAADCCSCVASLLEIARLIIDSGWVPPRPIILLFNGAEESFLLAIFSVPFLLSRSLKFPAKIDSILKRYTHFPYPHTINLPMLSRDGSRRVYLELSLGSLEEVWVAILNITGPISNWSFADNKLSSPKTAEGGPPSYISRLTGASHENWTFWLEASNSEDLRVDVAVLDQILVAETRKLKALFPAWADVVAYSSYLSTYIF